MVLFTPQKLHFKVEKTTIERINDLPWVTHSW